MKVAVSNIAWKPVDDDDVAEVMRACGANAVELAPTAYWPDPLQVATAERRRLRRAWEARGFPVVALQSLLYGFPDLNLFDPATRPAMLDRLLGMLDVAADLGAGPLVFGSPRNRRRSGLPMAEALEVAVPFFRTLGDAAAARGVCLCVEPNPPEYGCDFITTSAEGRELVARVDSPGFQLHLDAAALHLAGEDPVDAIEASKVPLRHFHLSSPNLGPVAMGSPVAFDVIMAQLRAAGYGGTVSVEMRAPHTGSPLPAVRGALLLARQLAGDA